jgi:hypothetical protein
MQWRNDWNPVPHPISKTFLGLNLWITSLDNKRCNLEYNHEYQKSMIWSYSIYLLKDLDYSFSLNELLYHCVNLISTFEILRYNILIYVP